MSRVSFSKQCRTSRDVIASELPGEEESTRDRKAEDPRGCGFEQEDVMNITVWMKGRSLRRTERRDERNRTRDAHQFGRDLARHWLAGRGSVIRSLTPGAGDSLVAAAFRHGLVEGTSMRDATSLAQAVLSGMGDAARNSPRRTRSGSRYLVASQWDTALRGVAWMAEQALRGVDVDYKLNRATIEKIRSWSLECPTPSQHGFPLTVGDRR
jgi:hypothetical protein